MLSITKLRGILLSPFVGFTLHADPWAFEGTMPIGLLLMGQFIIGSFSTISRNKYSNI